VGTSWPDVTFDQHQGVTATASGIRLLPLVLGLLIASLPEVAQT